MSTSVKTAKTAKTIAKTNKTTKTAKTMKTMKSVKTIKPARLTNPKQYLLAYCHSKKHCNDSIKKEIKNFNENIVIDTNDAHDFIEGDYTIDLSINTLREEDLLDIYQKKYDYIYLVNCPSNVYIKDNDLNPVIFENMLKILKPNGILLTKFSNDAIQEISSKDVHDFLFAEDNEELTPEFLEETNNKILQDKKKLIEIVRKGIRHYLRAEKLNMRLISFQENTQYVSPLFDEDIDAGYHEFFIFTKIHD